MGSRLGRGKVIRPILDEVFGIDKEFAVETETMFDKFYVERDRFLANPIDQGALISEGSTSPTAAKKFAQSRLTDIISRL